MIERRSRHAVATLAVLVAALLALPMTGVAGAQAPPRPPEITAPSAIVVEGESGAVAFARNADERRPIASATKLMTALVTLENARLSRTVRAVRYAAAPVESQIGLQPGERMTIADLVRALLVESANDAAETLAVRVAGSRASFIRRMNRRAQQLGLANTHFANPVGLDEPGNYSTARDLARLTLELRRYGFFRRVVDSPAVTLRSGARTRTLINRNTLVDELGWIDGVKTGQTNGAGYVLVASGIRRSIPMISVVLGTPSMQARNEDSLKLLEYGRRRVTRKTAISRGDIMAAVPIRYRAGAELKLQASRTVRRVVRRGQRLRVVLQGIPSEVAGPVRYGEKIGTAEVRLRGRPVTTVSLTAASSVPEAGVARRAQDWFSRPWVLAGLGGVILLLAIVAGRRPPDGRDAARRREEATAA